MAMRDGQKVFAYDPPIVLSPKCCQFHWRKELLIGMSFSAFLNVQNFWFIIHYKITRIRKCSKH